MAAPLRIALCQLDLVVGDIAGNEKKIIEGRSEGAQLVLVPELAVTGYPPEDLLLKEHFLLDARAALERIAGQTQGIVALVGFPELAEDVYNACGVLAEGEVKAIYRKVYLPNYGVFDEERYFQSGSGGATIELDENLVIGLTVCEDIWEPGPPASEEALAGATLLVNISASPYHAGKGLEREQMLAQRARDNLAVVAFCGLVGGQDELVFDGHSLVIDHEGEVIARGGQFSEELLVATIDPDASRAAPLATQRAPARSPKPAGRPPGRGIRRPGRAVARPARRGVRRAGARPARLRVQERLQARRHRCLRGYRLGAGRDDRGRRPRAGDGVHRRDASSVRSGGHSARCPPAGRQPRCRAARAADRGGDAGLRRRALGGVRRAAR